MSNTRIFLRFLIKIGEDDLDKNAVAWLPNKLEKHIQVN